MIQFGTLTIALYYLIGFVVCVVLLSIFGKRFGLDFKGTESDEWKNNRQAYTVFSLIWPIFLTLFICLVVWQVLTGITGIIISIFNRDEK